jgi:hypothetical protein
MTIIFSNTTIDGLEGVYATPMMATEVDVSKATVIYTDDDRLRLIADTLGVEVRDFPKYPPASATTTVEEVIPKAVVKRAPRTQKKD